MQDFLSPMSLLMNCTLSLVQKTYSGTDERGNPKSATPETTELRAYLRNGRSPAPPGADQQRMWLEGYAVDTQVLPDWIQGKAPALIEFTDGQRGSFEFVPQIRVARDIVEPVTGARIQGWFIQRI